MSMGRASRMIEIDGEALRRLIGEKGLTLADVSRVIGFSDSYVKQSCQKNIIRVAAAELIAAKMGIPLDAFEKKAEPAPEAPPAPILTEAAKAVVDYAVEQIRILLCECGLLGIIRYEKEDDLK